jgi:hypothetical protein
MSRPGWSHNIINKQMDHIYLMWVTSVAHTTCPIIVLIIQLTTSMSNMPVCDTKLANLHVVLLALVPWEFSWLHAVTTSTDTLHAQYYKLTAHAASIVITLAILTVLSGPGRWTHGFSWHRDNSSSGKNITDSTRFPVMAPSSRRSSGKSFPT